MGARIRWYGVIGAVLAATAMLAASLSACGGSEKAGGETTTVDTWTEWRSNEGMSGPMREEAIRGAQEEESVEKVLAGQAVASSEAVRWRGTDGTLLLGTAVRLRLKEPIRLDSTVMPAFVTPTARSPKPPIALKRTVRYTGSGVDELEVLMAMPRREVLEIIPRGGSVGPPRLIGAPLPRYQPIGQH